MQTFLPYADFARSAEVLDRRRLGKQRIEAMQVLNALTRPGHGWRHHPAALMWRGWEPALVAYGVAVCDAWTRLGFADTCRAQIAAGRDLLSQADLAAAGELPAWLGDTEFHRAHQSNLLRKDPDWYGRFFSGVPADLPYIWPRGRE